VIEREFEGFRGSESVCLSDSDFRLAVHALDGA
jgi:hypothetical protein